MTTLQRGALSLVAGVSVAVVVAAIVQLCRLGFVWLPFVLVVLTVGLQYLVMATPAGLLRRARAVSKFGRRFTPKYRFSTQNNPLCGIPLPALVKLLWIRRRHVDWQMYWFRILFLVFIAGLQSALGVVESLLYGKRIAKTEVNDR
jgi:hypothetical protein